MADGDAARLRVDLQPWPGRSLVLGFQGPPEAFDRHSDSTAATAASRLPCQATSGAIRGAPATDAHGLHRGRPPAAATDDLPSTGPRPLTQHSTGGQGSLGPPKLTVSLCWGCPLPHTGFPTRGLEPTWHLRENRKRPRLPRVLPRSRSNTNPDACAQPLSVPAPVTRSRPLSPRDSRRPQQNPRRPHRPSERALRLLVLIRP